MINDITSAYTDRNKYLRAGTGNKHHPSDFSREN